MFWSNKPVKFAFWPFWIEKKFLDQKSEVFKNRKNRHFPKVLVLSFCQIINLLMHKGKMDCIIFGTGPRLALYASFSVNIDRKVLNRASENKYLGVVLDPSLTWNAHVEYLVGNVRQRVALLGPIMKNINVTGTV